MSDKKVDQPAEELKGGDRENLDRPAEELETEQLDEAHGGGINIGGNFFTVNVQPNRFNTISGGEDFNTANGGQLFNDSPLKK